MPHFTFVYKALPLCATMRSWPLVLRCLFLAFFCTPSHAIVTDNYDLNLAAGSLHKAFVTLGQQTQSSIIFPSSLPDDNSAVAIVGNFTIVEALEKLIKQHDLEFRIVEPLTVVILPRCRSGRECTEIKQQLASSNQQYPMIEELIVRGKQITGSRFKQIDGNSFIPVDVITPTEIRLTGAQTLSQLMRYLPEVSGNSASTSVSNGGNGNASVTLRGLPATNTLVLINGMRTTSNAIDGKSVDLNSIPLAAVDRIEMLKDSGSSIYGSDAIAGVVNIILRNSMDGVLLNTYYGAADAGDNETQRYDIIAGGKVGEVDLLATASHYSQAGLMSRDRSISRSADARALGGVDKRSSATSNARLQLESGIVTLVSDNATGASSADFRPVTNDDLFDYAPYTSSLVPETRDSLYLSANVPELTDGVDASFELSYVKNSTLITFAPAPLFTAFEEVPITVSAKNQFNPFGQDIVDARIRLLGLGPRLQSNSSKTLRASSKLMGSLNNSEWQASVNWSQNRAAEAWRNLVSLENISLGLGDSDLCAAVDGCVPINIFAPAATMDRGQLEYIAADAFNRGRSTLASLNLDISQVIDAGAWQQIELAAGLEFRRETLTTKADERVENNQLIGGDYGSSYGQRNVSEFYIESLLPVLRGADGEPIVDANLSLRSTRYSDFGWQNNPKLALRYRPFEGLMFRGSVSQGFRAPSLFELNQSDSISQAFLQDPCANADISPTLVGCSGVTDPLRVQYLTVTGGNANLRPETSKNISLGFVYTPAGLHNFSFGLDAYQIRVDNIIGASGQFFLDQNAQHLLYAQRIVRDKNGEVVKVIANNDNLGLRKSIGLDAGVSWRQFIPQWGTVGINVSGSHIHSYQFQASPTSMMQELAGTFADEAAEGNGLLPKWKSKINLFWQFGRWEVALASFRVSSVREAVGANQQRDSGVWSTEELQINYHFNSGESLVTVGVENLFNEAPPFMASAFSDNFDSRTYDSTGRFIYARISHHL